MPEWIFYGINFVGCLVEYTLQALREPSLVTSRALGSYCWNQRRSASSFGSSPWCSARISCKNLVAFKRDAVDGHSGPERDKETDAAALAGSVPRD